MTVQGRGGDFVVDLGGLELRADTRQEIAADIQRAVLTRLVDLDYHGDIAVRFPSEDDPWFGRTQGIVIRTSDDALAVFEDH